MIHGYVEKHKPADERGVPRGTLCPPIHAKETITIETYGEVASLETEDFDASASPKQ